MIQDLDQILGIGANYTPNLILGGNVKHAATENNYLIFSYSNDGDFDWQQGDKLTISACFCVGDDDSGADNTINLEIGSGAVAGSLTPTAKNVEEIQTINVTIPPIVESKKKTFRAIASPFNQPPHSTNTYIKWLVVQRGHTDGISQWIPAASEESFPNHVRVKSASGAFPDMGKREIKLQGKFDGQTSLNITKEWEFAYKGNKYIMPLRKPQGEKNNESLSASTELPFEHWAEYMLQQEYFFELYSARAGTAIPDKYVAPVNLNFKDFCALYSQVLEFHYGNKITLDVDQATIDEASKDVQKIEIDYAYMWDVLPKFHEIFGVHWSIEPNGDIDHYVIKLRFGSQVELSHIFEYGFKGGLLKVEQQVQNPDIRNVILGRGGDKNLPYRYFKDVDPNNKSWAADPDWIPELAQMPFTQLRGATFRSYIRGWKAKHYGGKSTAAECYAPWAWEKGYTDKKFDPVEFVYDADSIAFYGVKRGALADNTEIYPSIQGRVRADIGRIDEIVAVEPIISDDYQAKSEKESQIYTANLCEPASVFVKSGTRATVKLVGGTFTIPEGLTGNLDVGAAAVEAWSITQLAGRRPDKHERDYDKYLIPTIKSVTVNRGQIAEGLPAGTYTWAAEIEVENSSDKDLTAKVQLPKPQVTASDIDEFGETWCVWIKDVFGNTKPSNQSPEAFAAAVWDPLIGDHLGNDAALFFTFGMLSTSDDYDFLLAKRPEYDPSQTIEVDGIGKVQSMWKLTLRKSDAELDVTGKWLPSTTRHAAAGDFFAFKGIELPHSYTLMAEEEIDNAKKAELERVKEIKPTRIVSLDKVRISTAQFDDVTALIDQLVPGAAVRLHDPRFILNAQGTPAAYETLYISNINIEWPEPSDSSPALIPDVEITLSDKYEVAASTVERMQSEIDTLARHIASIGNIEQLVRAVGDKLYLRKDGIADISMSPTQFFSLLSSGDFRAGMVGGAGWGCYRDANGNWVFETDRLNVRQEFAVNTLVVNQVRGQGGTITESAALIDEVTEVITDETGITCYFDTKTGTVFNQFRVDDIAQCHRFIPTTAADNTSEAFGTVKFYRRRIIEVGNNYIKLTLNPADINGSGLPEKGDCIIQRGNYTDKNRQYIKVRNVIGGGYERYIDGLDSVNAEGVEYFFVGRQAGMYNNRARFYLGDANGYIEWIDGKLNIKGELNLLSTIGGKTIGDYVSDAAQLAADAVREELQKQIDGVIESYNGQGAPTLTNYPANEWTTDAERQRHDRDIYTDITPFVDATTTPTSGQSWKWYYNSPTDYGWTKIADSEAVRALQLAQLSVLGVDVLYKQTNSPTDSPAIPSVNAVTGQITNLNGWSTKAPEWADGMYMWQTTYTRKGDGAATFSDPTCINGAKGQNGTSVTISEQSVTYSTNHGATQPADNTFTLTAVPALSDGQYLWSRTFVKYSNGQSTTSYAVSMIGSNGASYTPNLLLDSAFLKNDASGWLRILPISDDNGIKYYHPLYNWVCEQRRNYEAGIYTFSALARNTGDQPSVLRLNIETSPASDILITVQPNTDWHRVYGMTKVAAGTDVRTFVLLNGPAQPTTVDVAEIKLEQGENTAPQWTPAASEMVAPTITNTSVTYAKTAASTQPADSAFTYASIGAAGVQVGEYLWTKTEVTYSDGSFTKSYSVSRIGSDGSDGLPGTPGADGKTPYVHYAYANSADGQTDFNTAYFKGALYVGTCSDYNQADPTDPAAYEWARLKGEDGTDAKLVFINADNLVFVYKDNFATLVEPQSIALEATLQGTSGYQWSYKPQGASGFTNFQNGNSAGLTITQNMLPTLFPGNARSVLIRCTSSDKFDEVTIAKVSSGSNGTNYTNNLYVNSAFEDGTDNWILWQPAAESVANGVLTLTTAASQQIISNKKIEVKQGEKFTLSGWIKADRALTLDYSYLMYYEGANTFIKDNFVTDKNVTTDWKFFIIQFTAPRDGLASPGFGYMGVAGATLHVKQLKWERGTNNEPEWTPNSADMVGEDGYTIILPNESHIFEGDTEKAVAASTESAIIAYKGATRMAATIGTITGMPAGMTVQVANNGTASAKIIVSVTPTLVAKQGTLEVPVTVDDRIFTRIFSWSLSLQGKDGRGIVAVVEEYALSATTAMPDDSDFSPSMPTMTDAQPYLWNREKTTYSDNTSETTPAGIIGVKGQNGADGATVVSVTNYYLASSDASGVTTATSGWVTDPSANEAQASAEKPYLWNYEVTKWSKGPDTQTDPHVVGKYGKDGRTPIITEQYFLSTSNTQLLPATNQWQDTAPTWSAGFYIWTRSKIDYGDGDVRFTDPICATGASAPNLVAEYSSDATHWHPLYTADDIWMRTSNDGGDTWSTPMRITGASYSPNLILGGNVKHAATENNYLIFSYSNDGDFDWQQGDKLTISACFCVGDDDSGADNTINLEIGSGAVAGSLTPTAKNVEEIQTINVTIPPIVESKKKTFRAIASPFNQPPHSTNTYIKWLVVQRGHTDGISQWIPAASEMVGKDGTWRKFQWAKNNSTTTEPTSGWQDAPMTALAGEYIWMHSGLVVPPATEPAKYDAAVRLTGDKGQNGDSVYMLDLSDEMMPMACDVDGNVVSTYKTSQASVFKGGAAVAASEVAYSIAQATGVSAIISSSGLVTPSNLTADTASIVVQAVIKGVTLQTTLSLYKVKPGQSGANYSNNLYLNSAYEKGSDEWMLWRGHAQILNGALIAISSANQQIVTNRKIEVKAGEKFTLSGWIKADQQLSLNYNYLLYAEGANYQIPASAFITDNNVTTRYKFFIMQFTAPRDGLASPGFGYLGVDDASIWLKQLKWERGYNDDPEWTPASSDMVGKDGAAAVIYSLELSANNISRDALGNLSASTITVRKLKTTGDTAIEFTTEKSIRYQCIGVDSSATIVLDGVSSTNIDVPPSSELTAILVELLDSDGIAVLDRERIPVIQDGTKLTENLVRNSDKRISTADYLVGDFQLAEDLLIGKTYTFTIWGSLGASRNFQIYDSRASVKVGSLYKIADGVYSASLEWLKPSAGASARAFKVYQYPSVATTTSVIEKIKVEHGVNNAPVWTQCPEDVNYLTRAMQEDGSMSGGLILASLLRMGYTDSNTGKYKVMAGVNGIAIPKDALAFWAGGEMIDPDKEPTATDRSMFGVRHDGTAYAAGNTIRFKDKLIEVGDYINLTDDGLNMTIDGKKRLAVGNESIDGEYVLTARTRIILTNSLNLYNPGGMMPAYYQYSNALTYYIPSVSSIRASYPALGRVKKGQTIAFSSQNVFLNTPREGGSVNVSAVPALIVSYYDGSTLLTQSSQIRPQSTLSGSRLVYTLPTYTPTKDVSNLRIELSMVNQTTSSGLTSTTVQYSLSAPTTPFSLTIAFPQGALHDAAVLGVNGTQFSWGNTHQYQQNGLWGVRVGNYGIMINNDGIFVMTDGEQHVSLKSYIQGVINGSI